MRVSVGVTKLIPEHTAIAFEVDGSHVDEMVRVHGVFAYEIEHASGDEEGHQRGIGKGGREDDHHVCIFHPILMRKREMLGGLVFLFGDRPPFEI